MACPLSGRRAAALLISTALLGLGCTSGRGECGPDQPCAPGGVCLGQWCVYAPDDGLDGQPGCAGGGDAGTMVSGTPCVPEGFDPTGIVFEDTPCVRGTWVCDERGAPACRGFIGPGFELCDGVDDDCDGLADTDDPDVRFPAATGTVDYPPAGSPCFDGPRGAMLDDGGPIGTSRCRRGAWACGADGPACEGQILPAVEGDCAVARAGVDDDCDGEIDEGPEDFEVCDGVDNDCDGRVDEGRWADELCDGADNDCDGRVDEGRWADELCDGADNDCDGRVDEGYGWSDRVGVRFALGQRCVLGVGLCVALGTVTCNADGAQAACDATPGQPAAEICNGIDDDCDGQVDDVDRIGEPCIVGAGICAARGQYFCGRDGLTCDVMPGEPAAEICNGLDDDCDARIDEGISPLMERCNNIDDDCDGEVDNLAVGECLCLIGEGQPCYDGPPDTLDIGACVAGRQPCIELADGSADFGSCLDQVQPQAEVCNGQDDDCDGMTDEACT